MKPFAGLPIVDMGAILLIGLFLVFNVYLLNILVGTECGYQKPDFEKNCECMGMMNEDYFATHFSGYLQYMCIGLCENCVCKEPEEGSWINVECGE